MSYNMAYKMDNGVVELKSVKKLKTDIPDETKFEAFLHEMKSIRESLSEEGQEEGRVEEDPTEEGEADEQWLQMVGLEKILTQINSLSDCEEVDLDKSFTAKQVETIRKRVDTLSHTLRKRRNSMRPDVQDVFTSSLPFEQANTESGGEERHTPQSPSPSQSPPTPVRTKVHSPSPDKNTIEHQNGSKTPDAGSSRSSNSIEDEDITLAVGSPVQTPPGSPQASKKSIKRDSLPNFQLAPDPQGITCIGDLSPKDMQKIRHFALIELTTTFDQHGLALRIPKQEKVKFVKDQGVFGVALSTLVHTDRQRVDKVQIPLFLHEAIDFLEREGINTEGILRIPGQQSRMKAMVEELELLFAAGVFKWEDRRVSDVASLLKRFLRELPSPMLTRDYMRSFASIPSISTPKEQIKALNLLILLLPEIHQNSLKRLLQFLENIVLHQDRNKMDLDNVAMLIAPNLFYNLPQDPGMDQLTLAKGTTHVMKLLIKYHQLLWTIPGEMVNQVRILNSKGKKTGIMRRNKQTQGQTPAKSFETDNAIITVHAPFFMRVTMKVGLNFGMTADDIVTKLKKKSQLNEDFISRRLSSPPISSLGGDLALSDVTYSVPKVIPDKQFLFEVGGNIGERCLHPKTNMWELYRVNPSAHWVIKPRNCPDLM